MKTSWLLFLLKYFFTRFLRRKLKLITSVLSSFGSLWLIIQLSIFFFGEHSALVSTVKSYWYLFLVFGVLIAIIQTKPKNNFCCKLDNRDISIEIVIGDLFKQDGSLVIGSNTTFDTRITRNLISEKSIQGQFTNIFYNKNESQLDKEISLELQGIEPEILNENRVGKKERYPIGTVVKLTPKDKTIYMIAIADINEHGVATTTYDNLRNALAYLWLFISNKGLKENITIPILGTGFSRLTQSREEIIREIINSFIAACSESTFCDKLTIVLNPFDIEKYKIDMEELEKYIFHVCKYTKFQKSSEKIGQQI